MPRYTTARELTIAHNALTGDNLPLPPPPKKRKNEESIAQCAVIAWWAQECKERGVPECMLFSIPNGGRRSPREMIFLKREGLRPGICDLFLSVPRHPYAGLYVEMKTATGRISDEQHEFIARATELGYAAYVCRSDAEAKELIHNYLTDTDKIF